MRNDVAPSHSIGMCLSARHAILLSRVDDCQFVLEAAPQCRHVCTSTISVRNTVCVQHRDVLLSAVTCTRVPSGGRRHHRTGDSGRSSSCPRHQCTRVNEHIVRYDFLRTLPSSALRYLVMFLGDLCVHRSTAKPASNKCARVHHKRGADIDIGTLFSISATRYDHKIVETFVAWRCHACVCA